MSENMVTTEGSVLNYRYQIDRVLNDKGGMGLIYLATDLNLRGTVVLKKSRFVDEQSRSAFEREARLLYGLRHNALPRVIDYFLNDEGQFFVMEFIPGKDLSELLSARIEQGEGPFPLNQVLDWGEQLLDALDYLHAHNPPIIHRDIKPQNLKIMPNGQVILLDFGLAKGSVSGMTMGVSIQGYTPNYAPLEQMRGSGTDERSDIYSLAVTMHCLLSGQMPPDAVSRAIETLSAQPDPLHPLHLVNPNIPLVISEALQTASSLNQNERPQTARAMRDILLAARQKLANTENQTNPLVQVSNNSNQSSAAPSASPASAPSGSASSKAGVAAPSPFVNGAATRPSQELRLEIPTFAPSPFVAGLSGSLTNELSQPPAPAAPPVSAALAPDAVKTPVNRPQVAPTELNVAPSPSANAKDQPRAMATAPRHPAGTPLQTATSDGKTPLQPSDAGLVIIEHKDEGKEATQETTVPGTQSGYAPLRYDTPHGETPQSTAYTQTPLDQTPNVPPPQRPAPPAPPPYVPRPAAPANRTPEQDKQINQATLRRAMERAAMLDNARSIPPPSAQKRERQRDLGENRPPLTTASLAANVAPPGNTPNAAIEAPAPALPTPTTPVKAPITPGLRSFTEVVGFGVRVEMHAIPGGEFFMGSPERRGHPDEYPLHRVAVSPFFIGKFPITQKQYRALMRTNPSSYLDDAHPVESVTWDEAIEFCRRLTVATGRIYRLPTEAEWEYACRAGTTTRYNYGDDEDYLNQYCWNLTNAGNHTRAVGEKKPNGWGLCDMHGNVWEWCLDWYYTEYYQTSANVNPTGPVRGSSRVLRGGSWYSLPNYCRSATRSNHQPDQRDQMVGFRVVCEAR